MFSVLLHNPKYPHNVGQAVRAVSCFGAEALLINGDRVELEGRGKQYRLPREERIRAYDVPILKTTRPFDENPGLVPVAVEVSPSAESLPWFTHPENALYVFGPEDGSLPAGVLASCHRVVTIPMLHCANLASAIYVTLYDRHMKEVLAGASPLQMGAA